MAALVVGIAFRLQLMRVVWSDDGRSEVDTSYETLNHVEKVGVSESSA